MYMREMGTVELLTREGEISIAKRIEEGLDAVRGALATYPATIDHLLDAYENMKAGQGRLVDVIVGFIDPNAPDVIAQPQNPTKPVEAAEPKAAEGRGRRATTARNEEAVDTGPDPEEAARRFAQLREAAPRRAGQPGQARPGRPEDAEVAREGRGRVHGAEAVAAHVRGADHCSCAITSAKCASSRRRSW